MKAQTVKDYLAVHTWVGILCGLVLYVAFYAGAFSMLEAEITRWTQPSAPMPKALLSAAPAPIWSHAGTCLSRLSKHGR